MGDQRVLAMLEPHLAGQRELLPENDFDAGMTRDGVLIAAGEVHKGLRPGRAGEHGDLALLADLLRGPFGDLAADPVFVGGDVQHLRLACRAPRDRHHGNPRGLGLVVGAAQRLCVDRRDQYPVDALGDQVVDAVQLPRDVFLGGHHADLVAELLGADLDALEHRDVERVGVRGERHADGLGVRGSGEPDRGDGRQDGQRFAHYPFPPA